MGGFDQADIHEARTRLAEIAAIHPSLSKEGYGSAGDPGGVPLTAADPAEFLRAVEFLRRLEPVPTPDRNRTSTGYTHVAQRWWQKWHCGDPQADCRISNGVFIAAAIALEQIAGYLGRLYPAWRKQPEASSAVMLSSAGPSA
jgi:hypothetical protein